MSAAVRLRLTGERYAVPLRPEALASLDQSQVRHVLRVLRLDDQQVDVALAAVEMARRGAYPVGGMA